MLEEGPGQPHPQPRAVALVRLAACQCLRAQERAIICWLAFHQQLFQSLTNGWYPLLRLRSWLNVLSGGVEELRFTTGDSPVEAGPTLAPRLPGVIAATRWAFAHAGSLAGKSTGLAGRAGLSRLQEALVNERARGRLSCCLASQECISAQVAAKSLHALGVCCLPLSHCPELVGTHPSKTAAALSLPPLLAAPAPCWSLPASTRWPPARAPTSTTPLACMPCGATTTRVACLAPRRARCRCTSTRR